MRVFHAYKFSVLYLCAIPFTNWMFAYIGVLRVPFTDYVFHPLAFLVGFWLVLRDFAHRELGDRWIFAPVFAGVAISFATSSPRIAFASAIAFLVSELVDYAVYKLSKRPLHQRIVLSSAASVPVDSVIFSGMAFGLASVNPVTFLIMLAAKMSGAVVVAFAIRRLR